MKRPTKTVLLLLGVCALFLSFSYFWNQRFGDRPALAAAEQDEAPSTSDQQSVFPADKQLVAPDFSLHDVQTGATTQLSAAVKARPVVFSFWATWCGPCNQELPVLEALSKKYNGRVSFYGINSNDNPATVRQFVASKGLTMPMLDDTGGFASSAYSVQSIPRLVVVGTDGKIKYQIDGFDPNEDQFLPTILDQVLAENHTGVSGFFSGLFSRRS